MLQRRVPVPLAVRGGGLYLSSGRRFARAATDSTLRAIRAAVGLAQALAPSGRRRFVLEVRASVGVALRDLALAHPGEFGSASESDHRMSHYDWYYVPEPPQEPRGCRSPALRRPPLR